MTENLLRFNKSQKYLSFDTETENLALFNCNDHKNRPWEIGWTLSTRLKKIEEKCLYPWWPDLKVSDDAARITRFNYESYKSKAKDARKCLDYFSERLYDPSVIIIGQNILNFDAYVIQNWRQDLGLKPDWSFIERTIDTRALAFAIQKGVKTVDRDDLFCWQMKYMNTREKGIKTSLEWLCKYYSLGYDSQSHHGAEYDSRMTFEIFKKQMWEVEI